MILEPGMDVECIQGHGLAKTGGKYVIEECFTATFSKTPMVSLVGIHRPPEKTAFILAMMAHMGLPLFAPTGFEVWRFRPIKKTDISELQKLTKVDEKVLEEV